MAGEVLPSGSTNTQGLADWAAPYVTGYLGKAQALAETPYEVYKGPLTAGQSGLQTQAFTGLGSLTVPTSIAESAATAGDYAKRAGTMSYTPQTMDFLGNQNRSGLTINQPPASGGGNMGTMGGTGAYNPATGGYDLGTAGAPQNGIAGLTPPQTSQQPSNIAQQYMNPYLQAALNPQLEEARRQSQITQTLNAGKMTQAGAFGGGRQAILDAENQRNLGTNLSKITGEGYNTAYDKAMAQFNADQARKMAEGQFGATYGLDALKTGITGAQTQGQLGTQQSQADIANLNAKLAGGNVERGITSEGTAADLAEFEKQRQYPYQQVQFMRDMISGLPTGSVTNTAGQMSGVGSLLSALGGGAAAAKAFGYKDVSELLKGLGLDFGSAP